MGGYGSSRDWHWIVTDLDGRTITLLDRQARNRSIAYRLNAFTTISGEVSSDNPEINILHDDGAPFLAEGARLLYCLRRDRDGDVTAPYEDPYQCRAAGIIMEIEDAGSSDTSVSTFTAYDPWQYLYSLPVVNLADLDLTEREPTGNVDTAYTAGTRLDEIVLDLLVNAELMYRGPNGTNCQTRIDWGQFGPAPGTIEALAALANELTFAKELSIGEAFDQLCDLGNCDIVLTPIYDPVARPGMLAELNVYARAGEERAEAVFSWDKPSRSMISVSRRIDGHSRANNVRFHQQMGGEANRVYRSEASRNRYGDYWASQFFPNDEVDTQINLFAEQYLREVSTGAKTVRFTPTPERTPDPFIEWNLGDFVRVHSSRKLRATQAGFQRVSAFTLNISDDALEALSEVEVYVSGFEPTFDQQQIRTTLVSPTQKPMLAARSTMVGTWGGRG